MTYEAEKQIVAKKASELVQTGMKVGIGTGSTASIFINILKERVLKEKLSIACVCTSLRSEELIGNSIPLIDPSLETELDITFDGADRADPKTFVLIKGGGGALLREKLVAKSSKINIVLVDSSKITHPLEGFPVAIEIVPFGYKATITRIESLGYSGKLRKTKDQKPALSDNGNYLYDIHFQGPIEDPETEHNQLKSLLGVVETGFFLDTASFLYIGNPNQTVTILERP